MSLLVVGRDSLKLFATFQKDLTLASKLSSSCLTGLALVAIDHEFELENVPIYSSRDFCRIGKFWPNEFGQYTSNRKIDQRQSKSLYDLLCEISVLLNAHLLVHSSCLH